MAFTPYDSRSLVRAVSDLYQPSTFLLRAFFPIEQTFDTETIDFDVIKKGRKLAPFVSPLVQGKPQRDRGYETKSLKPAYVKMKDRVDPARVLKRRAGESYAGAMSPDRRRNAIIADIGLEHMESLDARLEWMAAQCLLTGKVTIQGEDYPTAEVDFGRDASLTRALAGGSQWGDAGVKPLDDLEAWVTDMEKISRVNVTDVILDPSAWSLLRADADFKEMLDTRRGSEARLEVAPNGHLGASFKGEAGGYLFWTYNEFYEDDAGALQPHMPANTVVLASRQMEGVQVFGAILDPNSNYQAARFWPRHWISDDPAAEFYMTQSAPLVVPFRPNASMAITVK